MADAWESPEEVVAWRTWRRLGTSVAGYGVAAALAHVLAGTGVAPAVAYQLVVATAIFDLHLWWTFFRPARESAA